MDFYFKIWIGFEREKFNQFDVKLYNSSKRNNNCDARDCIREFYDKYIFLFEIFNQFFKWVNGQL